MEKIIIDPAAIIRYTRVHKKRLFITMDEISFILDHPHSAAAKLQWLLEYMSYLRILVHKPIGICLSTHEIDFVVQDQQLAIADKLLWIVLAALSAHHPKLQWVGDFYLLARWLGCSTVMIGRRVSQLITMGYVLKEELGGEVRRLTVTLPNSGLLVLKLAPQEWPTPFKAAYQEQEERCTINLFPKKKVIG